MVKSVIKEILIIILLIVAILLILGIMFYEYTPNSKQVPTAVAEYTLSADIEKELNETIKAQETQNIIETYRVDDDDLALDRRKKIYEEGKINPFSKSAEIQVAVIIQAAIQILQEIHKEQEMRVNY